MKLYHAIIIALICKLCLAAPTEQDAKEFVARASETFYKLYDGIMEENMLHNENDATQDSDELVASLNTVKKIATELIQISEEASEYNFNQIHDPELKKAISNLRELVYVFALGDSFFDNTLKVTEDLEKLTVSKDIEPYMGGINRPGQDDSAIAFNPEILEIIKKSNDPEELLYYWEACRETEIEMRRLHFHSLMDDIKNTAEILERPVLDLYYSAFEVNEFLAEMEKVMEELKPAYEQLHAFIRHELYKKYGSEVIDPNGPIPDHLFQQVPAQEWKEGSVIESYFPFKDLPPVDDFVKKFNSRQIFEEAQGFYKSLGFDDLDSDFLKNRLLEIEDTENDSDCRAEIVDVTPTTYLHYCQMVDFRKFLQMHGYIGHIHYAQQKKNLPAYFFDSYDLKEPVGEAVILSASTPKHLQAIGLATDFKFNDIVLMNRLTRMAIHTIMNIPIYYVQGKVINEYLNGTLELDETNKRYWKLMEKYAGVEPPTDREDVAFDFPFKFYLDLLDNHQTKKFVSEILGYQFYQAFCKKSKHTGPLYNCDFYGNKDVGNDLKAMMSLGSSKPWSEVISRVLGDKSSLSADALLDYYAPIIDWAKGLNAQNHVKVGWNNSKRIVL